MMRFRTAAAAVGVIATTGLFAGTAQANAAPSTQTAVSTAAHAAADNLTPSAFTPWLCKKFRWLPPICPRR